MNLLSLSTRKDLYIGFTFLLFNLNSFEFRSEKEREKANRATKANRAENDGRGNHLKRFRDGSKYNEKRK